MSWANSTECSMCEKQLSVADQLDVSIFAKDLTGKYIYANDTFAKAAGVDSKEQIIGCSDSDLFWRDQADIFRAGDLRTLDGQPFVKVPEILIQPSGARKVCTTKSILKSSSGKTTGIVGSFIDITNYTMFKNTAQFMDSSNKLSLGPLFNNIFLSFKEARVLYFLLLGYSTPRISKTLTLSQNTINYHIKNLKYKLQCGSKGELVEKTVVSGISFTLFDRFLQNSHREHSNALTRGCFSTGRSMV